MKKDSTLSNGKWETLTYEILGATDLELAFGDEGKGLQRVGDVLVHSLRS